MQTDGSGRLEEEEVHRFLQELSLTASLQESRVVFLLLRPKDSTSVTYDEIIGRSRAPPALPRPLRRRAPSARRSGPHEVPGRKVASLTAVPPRTGRGTRRVQLVREGAQEEAELPRRRRRRLSSRPT